MKISGSYRTRNPVNGTKQILGQNRGMSTIAQSAIDNIASIAARKSVEAIATDSWPVYVHRLRPGTFTCSCRKEADEEYNDTYSLDDPDSLLNLKETDYSSADEGFEGNFKTSIQLRGAGVKDSHLKRDDTLRPADPTFADLTQEGLRDSTLDGNYPVEPNTDFSDLISMFPSLGSQCGVCGGNGMRDAYEWVSGTKILLVPDNMSSSSGNVIVDRSTKPWSVQIDAADATSYGEWTITIPAYHLGLDIVRVKDNLGLSPEFTIEARNPVQGNENANDAWVALTKAFLQPYLSVGLANLRVRVRLNKAISQSSDSYATFTHVEIWLLANELPRCQFPQIDRDIMGGTAEALIVTEFEIDPGVGRLPRGSLIENPAMGRMFIVTGVISKETSKRYVFNITGRLTLVSVTDGPYGLAARPSFSGQPNVNWRGAERSRFDKGLPYSRKTRLVDNLPTTNDKIGK